MTNNHRIKQTRSLNAEDKAQRREDIINAAEQSFFSTHYDKVSIGDIAKAAGLSRTLIYVYFKDKADLYLAIMIRASNELNRCFIQSINADMNGLEQIKALGYGYYHFYRLHTKYFHMFSDASSLLVNFPSEPSSKEQQTMTLLIRTYRECMAIMIKAISSGVTDGSICKTRGADPVKATYFLRGMLHGVLLSGSSDKVFIDKFCDFNLDELVDYCIDNASHILANKE
jgi:AcrR family transcriptional regulator